jgi:hypothetical protein
MYLCLLDDVNLTGNVQLGPYVVRSRNASELRGMLRGRDDAAPTAEEEDELKRLALFPWASIELAIDNHSELRGRYAGWAAISDLQWARLKFSWKRTIGQTNWPFDDLLRTLNLLKPSGGPVFGCYYYFRPFEEIQTRAQVCRAIKRQPLMTTEGESGEGGPAVWEYNLGTEDQADYSRLTEQLERCLTRSISDGEPTNAHLRIAVHYFGRADERVITAPNDFDSIDPLIAYDAAIEALLVRENERGSEKLLRNRAPAIVGDAPSEACHGQLRSEGDPVGCQRPIAPDEVEHLIERMYWLRSKIAHGVRSPEEINDLISYQGASAVDAIPEGPYDRLFVESAPFPGFLMNVRELARRCIRHFCDEYARGRSRDETLERLDARDCHEADRQ